MRKLLLLLPVLLFAAQAKGQDDAKPFDHGRMEGNRYVNTYFDIELNVPDDWVVQSKEQMAGLKELGVEMVSGDDANMKAVLKASEVNSAELLGAFQYEIGSEVVFNPSFMLMAENLTLAPGIKNGREYLFQARKMIANSQLEYDRLDEEFEHEQINGMDLYKMHAQINMMGIDIKQIYYATTMKRFALIAIVSYVEEDQHKVLKQILGSMKRTSGTTGK